MQFLFALVVLLLLRITFTNGDCGQPGMFKNSIIANPRATYPEDYVVYYDCTGEEVVKTIRNPFRMCLLGKWHGPMLRCAFRKYVSIKDLQYTYNDDSAKVIVNTPGPLVEGIGFNIDRKNYPKDPFCGVIRGISYHGNESSVINQSSDETNQTASCILWSHFEGTRAVDSIRVEFGCDDTCPDYLIGHDWRFFNYIANDCGTPDLPIGGRVLGSHAVNQSLYFNLTCDDGFEEFGIPIAVCEDSTYRYSNFDCVPRTHHWTLVLIATSVISIASTLLVHWTAKKFPYLLKYMRLRYRRFEELDVESSADNLKNSEDPFLVKIEQSHPKNWNITSPVKVVITDRQLGSGHFGVVMKGKIVLAKKTFDVAVKMVRDRTVQSQVDALEHEKQIYEHLGCHVNIVNLVGTVSDDLDRTDLKIVLEFCPHENLSNFVKNHRDVLNQELAQNFFKSLILSFAFQIANGMRHLANLGFVHRDLAARNVLVASSNIVKISDFGSASKFGNTIGDCSQFAFRWQAIEAFRNIFSQKSDVWSYGITIWEIFTFGLVPFECFTSSQELLLFLNSGRRLPRPENCPNAMHKLMTNCWTSNPRSRPSFENISAELVNIIDDGTRVEYVQLSEAFERTNERLMATNDENCSQIAVRNLFLNDNSELTE